MDRRIRNECKECFDKMWDLFSSVANIDTHQAEIKSFIETKEVGHMLLSEACRKETDLGVELAVEKYVLSRLS